MRLLKKLQENRLYWQYRYVTKRWLALKRWWREIRQFRRGPMPVRPQFRGMAAASPYRGASGLDRNRGLAFTLLLAALETALSVATIHHDGFSVGLLRIALLSALAYVFVRYW